MSRNNEAIIHPHEKSSEQRCLSCHGFMTCIEIVYARLLFSLLKAYFKSLLKPEFSPRDTSTTKRQQEEATFLYLLDFLEECEGNFHPCISKSCNIYTCTVTADGKVYTEAGLQEHMLIFFTGTDREPPLGFPKHPQLIFLHTGILATASTCDLILRIPTVFHNNYLAFRDMMVESLVSSEGFGVA